MTKIDVIVILSAAFLGVHSSLACAAVVGVNQNLFAGFYMGVHAGYGWSSVEEDYSFNMGVQPIQIEKTDGGAGSCTLDAYGAVLGAQAGANFVISSGLLLGAEVNGSWTAMAAEISFPVLGSKILCSEPLAYGNDVGAESQGSAIGVA